VGSKTVTDAIDWLKTSNVPVVLSPGKATYYSFEEGKIVLGVGSDVGYRGTSLAHEVYHPQYGTQEISDPRKVGQAQFTDEVVHHEIRAATKAVDATRELRAKGFFPGTVAATDFYDARYYQATVNYRYRYPNASPAEVDRYGYAQGIATMAAAYRDGTLKDSKTGLSYRAEAAQAWRDSQ
jgi:hypothetical protein